MNNMKNTTVKLKSGIEMPIDWINSLSFDPRYKTYTLIEKTGSTHGLTKAEFDEVKKVCEECIREELLNEKLSIRQVIKAIKRNKVIQDNFSKDFMEDLVDSLLISLKDEVNHMEKVDRYAHSPKR